MGVSTGRPSNASRKACATPLTNGLPLAEGARPSSARRACASGCSAECRHIRSSRAVLASSIMARCCASTISRTRLAVASGFPNHGSERRKYVDAFFANIDWRVVDGHPDARMNVPGSARRRSPRGVLTVAARPVGATPENDLDPENLVSDSLPARARTDEEEGRGLPFAILPQAGYGRRRPKVASSSKAAISSEARPSATRTSSSPSIASRKPGSTSATPSSGRSCCSGPPPGTRSGRRVLRARQQQGRSRTALSQGMQRARVGSLSLYTCAASRSSSPPSIVTPTSPTGAATTPLDPTFRPRSSGRPWRAVELPLRRPRLQLARRPGTSDRRVGDHRQISLGRPRALDRDTDYQKLIFDVSYIQPLDWRRQVIALHANTEVVFGDDEDIPFFELSSLGGDDTMRGYHSASSAKAAHS